MLHTHSVILGKGQSVATQGTFVVHLPAVAATTFLYTTAVTLPGLLQDDVMTVTLNRNVASGVGIEQTGVILASATPQDGQVTLSFLNIGDATSYNEHIVSYTISR